MNSRKEAEILRLFERAEKLYEKGGKCLHPEAPGCCPCRHEGSSFIVIDGKPASCSCGQCKRYKCLECSLSQAMTPFCVTMKKLAMAEL